MNFSSTRRDFLATTLKAGAIASLGDFAFLRTLPAVANADVPPGMVQLNSEIEPLVRLIEDTPREKLLEAAVERIRKGTSYQELLAAVLLAGVRGIKPRPVGFKFHAVLVIHSAHLASLAAADRDRWLPLLWSLDNFKVSQAENKKQGGWVMPAVEEGKLPPVTQARQRFVEAMDNWDEEGADRAVVPWVRSAGANEVIELFFRYGMRDFRDIGHKAIFVANSWRAMHTVGWRHAEPVLRSLAFALLEHEGDNPAKRDGEPDRPWRENQKRAAQIRKDWRQGKAEPSAAAELLACGRTASPSEASAKVVDLLNKGVDPASVWDGLFLTAGELLMRQPGIGGLHCVTTMNALHYAYQATAIDDTRRMAMLQGAAFMPMFRDFMGGRGKLGDVNVDALEKAELNADGAEAVEAVYADVGKDHVAAARKVLALLHKDQAAADSLISAGRLLIFNKGTNSHDYKFSSAAMEDYYHATPAWRARYLATSMAWLKGTHDEDNDLIKRARAALA